VVRFGEAKMHDGREPLNILLLLLGHCSSSNTPFSIKLHLQVEVEVQMLVGISPVIQLLERTSDFKDGRLNRESGIDPYNFMSLRIIYCRFLDEVEFKVATTDDKFPVSFLLCERLIASILG